jgi:hypothetical protein
MTLVRKELIRPDQATLPDDDGFRFADTLIRDAAYDSIPKRLRADLNERFANWIESRLGRDAPDEIIGYHLEQAHRYRTELSQIDETAQALGRQAAQRLGAGGRRAFARSDASAAFNLISRAVSLLPADDSARVDLIPTMRVMQGLSGDLTWAHRVLSEAIAAGNERLKAHALVQGSFLRLFTEPDVRPAELIDAADQLIGLFEALEDEVGFARAWRLKAQAHYLARRAGASVDASEQALLHIRRAGDSFEQREIVELLVIALSVGRRRLRRPKQPSAAPCCSTTCAVVHSMRQSSLRSSRTSNRCGGTGPSRASDRTSASRDAQARRDALAPGDRDRERSAAGGRPCRRGARASPGV